MGATFRFGEESARFSEATIEKMFSETEDAKILLNVDDPYARSILKIFMMAAFDAGRRNMRAEPGLSPTEEADLRQALAIEDGAFDAISFDAISAESVRRLLLKLNETWGNLARAKDRLAVLEEKIIRLMQTDGNDGMFDSQLFMKAREDIKALVKFTRMSHEEYGRILNDESSAPRE